MITPKEIQEQSLKWWKEILLSFIDGTTIFPKEINRIGRVSPKDILNKLSEYKQSIELLKINSKENKKFGYTLITEERQFDKIGKQIVPLKVSIDSIEDYLAVTRKEKDYQIFCKNFSMLIEQLAVLKDWIKANPLKLIEHESWNDTLKVCKYFLSTPKPQLYIRQLPIDIHTKYIQENKAVVQSLLEFLIPEYINADKKAFELRFNLKYAEPLIRVRFLDTTLSPLDSATDISLTLSEFNNFNCDCDSIFVAENIMNFLTLPYLTKTVAIWSGGGFNVSYLKGIDWLKSKQFYYWGDIDAQGFQILNQFRTYFPNTVATMMDEETLSCFKEMIVKGYPAKEQSLQYLSASETRFYDYLKENNIRLEQEKITQRYAEKKINSLVKDKSYNRK